MARLNADGTADSSFGGGNLVVTDFFGFRDDFSSVVRLADGKIVVGGSVTPSSCGASSCPTAYGLARYSSTGTLDPGFGSGGKATAVFAGGAGHPKDMALQPDGRIVIVGSLGDAASSTIPSEDIMAARFLADGSLDPSFGSGGMVRFGRGYPSPGVGSQEVLNALALQAGGKILVAGAAAANGDSPASFLVGRLNANGSWDLTYGAGTGFVTTSIGSSAAAYGAGIQAGGKFVVAGFAEAVPPTFATSFAVARYLPG